MSDVEQRFWARVNKTRTCWEWTGTLGSKGYGRILFKKKNRGAHRISFAMHNDRWDILSTPKAFVCHHCDNPKCVRPDHLFLGTASDNMKDMMSKNRHKLAKRTHCKYGHPYNETNTLRFKSLQGRVCRKCKQIAKKEENKRRDPEKERMYSRNSWRRRHGVDPSRYKV